MNMDDEYQLMKYRQEIGADITMKDLIDAHRKWNAINQCADALISDFGPDALRAESVAKIDEWLHGDGKCVS